MMRLDREMCFEDVSANAAKVLMLAANTAVQDGAVSRGFPKRTE